ncbi:MAG: hypothetical protein H7Y11_13085 [Armatimonadetes bacterium]|nr:hypothetical protein [Anaerolineae bacterium]
MPTSLTAVYQMAKFIDTFALGHYARVLDATERATGRSVAFKVLRPEHLSADGDVRWEYRAFPYEADLLMRLASSPQIIRLYDCGYVQTSDEAPTQGDMVSFGQDAAAYAQAMPEYHTLGWRPYLALEPLPRAANLLYLMKPSRPDVRWRLPTEEGLALAMQFGLLLQQAHRQGIAYMDHKLEHVYWDGSGLRVIDLNSSRLVESGSREQYFKLDVHNLCVGILYPIFTGLAPQKTALRAQPSSMAEVEARYQDIAALDFGIEPTLSGALQTLLQRGAAQQFEDADQFLSELGEVCALHGWDLPRQTTRPPDRLARDHLRDGLRKLRAGQDAIREARDAFRDAAVLDGITPDLEAELRRLVKAANDMLNQRVIP